jgi:DNA-binding MarR family transcriptional regulator
LTTFVKYLYDVSIQSFHPVILSATRRCPVTPTPDFVFPHVVAAVEALVRRTGDDLRTMRADADVPITRGSHGRILQLLPPEGARPTELAEGGWVTKQAIGQRVRELEDLDLVRTDPDPADGRAVIVRRTPAGDEVDQRLQAAIAQLEQSWARQVGEDRYAVFRAVLDELGAAHAPALLLTDADGPTIA